MRPVEQTRPIRLRSPPTPRCPACREDSGLPHRCTTMTGNSPPVSTKSPSEICSSTDASIDAFVDAFVTPGNEDEPFLARQRLDLALFAAVRLAATDTPSAPGHPRAASARRSRARSGSTFITIPGPPPYGRSSTVLCRSSAWSRGFSTSTIQRALRDRARHYTFAGERPEHVREDTDDAHPHSPLLVRLPIDDDSPLLADPRPSPRGARTESGLHRAHRAPRSRRWRRSRSIPTTSPSTVPA